MASNHKSKLKGFTLIELLVALVIFAILSALSYRSLSALIQTKQRIEDETTKWREVMLFFNRLDSDLRHVVNRSIRVDKSQQPAFLAKPNLSTLDDAQLSFTRLGNPLQTGTLMDTQRIAYRYKSGNIELLISSGLDVESTSKPAVFTVLRGVKSMVLRYKPARSNVWINAWPMPSYENAIMPKAVEISIVLSSGETLKRIFLLP